MIERKSLAEGHFVEHSAQFFLAECSTRLPLAYLISQQQSIFPLMVIGVNVRRNQPQGSNVGLNVRLSNEPSRLYYSGGGRFKAMNGNLFCIFSTENYPV